MKNLSNFKIIIKTRVYLIQAIYQMLFSNDDIQTDFFCRSHYTDINIGKWNKPYKLDIENMGSSMLPKVA